MPTERGRAGRSLGAYTGLAAVLKGLPLAYDRDLQEDKPHVFTAVDATLDSLEAAALLAGHLELDVKAMRTAAKDPDLLATDTAEKLVAEGRPFREVHGEVGRSVLAGGHRPPWDAAESLRRRSQPGGPAPAAVRREARAVHRQAAALSRWAGAHT